MCVALSLTAFKTMESKNKRRAVMKWEYTSTSLLNAKNPLYYIEVLDSGPTCIGSGNICTIGYSTLDFDSLEEFLQSFPSTNALLSYPTTIQKF